MCKAGVWLARACTCAGMSDTKRRRLDALSTVFTYIFTAECCMKLLGYGLAGFCSDGMNLFDAAVVVLSLVDTFASVRTPAALAAALCLPACRHERPLFVGPRCGLHGADVAVCI